MLEEDEIREWAAELLKVISAHCHCGCVNNPLTRMKITDRLRLWALAVVQSAAFRPELPEIPPGWMFENGHQLPEIHLGDDELPEMPS